MKRVLLAFAAAAVAALGCAGSAIARTYNVAACDGAGGLNRSWQGDGGTSHVFVRQRCPAMSSADGLFARSATTADGSRRGEGAGWTFVAPAGTSISSLRWAGQYWATTAGWVAGMESSRGGLFTCGPAATPCSSLWSAGRKPVTKTVGAASWLRFGVRCAAPSCRNGDGAVHPNALAAAWLLDVTVDDPTPPSVVGSGEAWDHDWVRPGASVELAATDATGVSAVTVERNGQPFREQSFSCDYTRPRPCADQISRYELSQPGKATWTLLATDAAGNESRVSHTIGVDGTPPKAPGPTVAQGEQWRTGARFDLTWNLPVENDSAPVASTRVDVCPAADSDAECLEPIKVDASDPQQAHVRLPAPGEWTARLTMRDQAGNEDASSLGPIAYLRWDPIVPSAPRLSAPSGWLTRDAAMAAKVGVLDGAASTQASGIAGWCWSAGLDPGDMINLRPGELLPVGDLPEGETEIRARSISGAGLASSSVGRAIVKIDDSAPTADLSGADATWHRAPVTVAITGSDQPTLSGFGGGSDSHAEARLWLDGAIAARQAGAAAELVVDQDGKHSVAADVSDAAGNRSGRIRGLVYIDTTSPERTVFLPQDPANPRIIRVDASDSISGVASVRIRMRPLAGGDWKEIPAEIRGRRAEAVLDDSGMAAGAWELQAIAADEAGNETIADRTTAGDPALIALPLRAPSRLEVKVGSAPGSASAASVDVLGHGQPGTVTGRVIGDHELPLEGARVTLEARASIDGAPWSVEATGTTDAGGRYSFSLPAGPSRRFRVSWGGDYRRSPSIIETSVSVPAWTSLAVSPGTVRVGRAALFSGRVDGGWVPSSGKLVLLQAWIPGRGWQTFESTRTSASGAWRAGYRFRAAVGRVRYSIRAFIPGEAGYPFAAAASRPIRVTAVG